MVWQLWRVVPEFHHGDGDFDDDCDESGAPQPQARNSNQHHNNQLGRPPRLDMAVLHSQHAPGVGVHEVARHHRQVLLRISREVCEDGLQVLTLISSGCEGVVCSAKDCMISVSALLCYFYHRGTLSYPALWPWYHWPLAGWCW